MSKTDIRLLYQKYSSLCLDIVNRISENPSLQYGERDSDTLAYIEWLETELEIALSVGEQLFNILLENEKSNKG